MNRSCFQIRAGALAAALVLFTSGLVMGQDGGGSLTRDILGGAALVFRKPENPPVGGGRLWQRPTPPKISRAHTQRIARGNAARTAGTPRYEEAEREYIEAARLDPLDPRAFVGLGNVYLDQGFFKKAAEQYKKAVELKPDYLDAYMPLGFAYVRLNQYDNAKDAYLKAGEIDPENPEVHNNLSYVYNHQEAYSKAIESSEKAITLLGETGRSYQQGYQVRQQVLAHAYKNLGNAYSGLKQYRKAAEALKQATVIEPKNAAAHFNLGLTLYSDGRYSESILAYKEAVRLRPTLAAGYFNLALAYSAIDDRSAALAEYKTLKTLNPKLAEQLYTMIKQ
ncbi:MAG: tetratricopeptide repeat protein [Pyrinomonadaceae bacterium]